MTVSSSLPQQAAASPIEQELEQIAEKVLQLAANHQRSGQIQEAEDLYRAILEIRPRHPEANYNLGLLEVRAQRPSAGLPYLGAAVEARPEQEQYWLAYIDALIHADQAEHARQMLELGRQHGLQGAAAENLAGRLETPAQAMAPSAPPPRKDGPAKATRSKKSAKARHGATAPGSREMDAVVALYGQGRITEVEALARSLTQRFPQHGFGWKVLAGIFLSQEKAEDALLFMQNSVKFLPDDAEAHSNLGSMLVDQGRLAEAEASLRRALELKPDYAEVYYSLSQILQGQGRLAETDASLRKALALKPDYADAHNNLSIILQGMGRHAEALVSGRQALALDPNSAYRHSNLLFCLSQMEGIDAETLFAEHCRFGEQFEAPARALWTEHGNSRDPERCLQIGFVSGDLRNHAVASFIEPVLEHLARNQKLSLHAYYNFKKEDSATQRLRGYFAHWHPVAGLSDEAMEKQIRADGIDILIDLSGHTAHNRLPLFARKPAPVQASWIGYPGTTGLQAVDYYLSDHFRLPLGKYDRQFIEKIVRMPVSAPFLPYETAPSVNLLPAISNGYVTFGSFNRVSKLSHAVIALWSQLLHALPDSKMVLGGMSQDEQYDTLIEWFAQEGIARERLSFHPRTSMDAYLRLHHQVDICLNPFPYTGATTLCHALWMGVPTLTLTGKTIPSHGGASYLSHVGLEKFVAQDAADFVRKGLFWTGNLPALANLRADLRQRFKRSAVGQPAVAAAGLEQALRIMWRRWCAGLPVASFEVDLNKISKVTPEVDK